MGIYNIYVLERGFDVTNGIENEKRVYGYFNNWNDIKQFLVNDNKKSLSPIFHGYFTLREAEMTYEKSFQHMKEKNNSKSKNIIKTYDVTCLHFNGQIYTDINAFKNAVLMSNNKEYIKIVI